MTNTFGHHVTNFGLKMDFNPIIKQFNLIDNYVIQHWQAKPFGYRQFGYLSVAKGESTYITIPHPYCKIFVIPETLQIDERYNLGRVPVGVLLYKNARLVKSTIQNQWAIISIDKDDDK